MSALEAALRLDVGLEDDADPTEIEGAALQLRSELLELDVDAVEGLPGDAPPSDARAAEVALLGALMVNVGRGAIRSVVQTVQAWVARSSTRSVKVTLDGDTIELTNVSDEDQRRLIESFVTRHASSA